MDSIAPADKTLRDVIRGRTVVSCFVWGTVAAATLGRPGVAFAQGEQPPNAEAPADETKADEATSSPMDVDAAGVPTQPLEGAKGAGEVEKAMAQVAEQTERGLPAEFTIKFGDTYDWLRLTSGEWLKGTLKRLREKQIDFDSDKLDLVTFDWEKVDRLHCPQVNTYVFADKVDVVGRAVVMEDTVLIETVDGVEEHPRDDLLSIVDGAPRERNWWSSEIGAGFSANAGNTNQGSISAYFQLMRADYRTRMKLRYDGAFGYADKQQNVNRQIGHAELRLFMSERWFFTPAAAQFLNDRFQNIRFRATPGAGAGVHVFDLKKVEWDLKAGLGYQYLDSRSVAAGTPNPRNDGFVSAGTWAKFEFVDDVELEIEWTTNFVYTTIGLTNHTGRAEFTVDITDIFDFGASLLFLRTENPPPREDGTVPSKNDYQVLVSVALEIG